MSDSKHEETKTKPEHEMPTCWGHVCMALQIKFTGHQRSRQILNVCNYNNQVRGWMN